MRYHLGLGVGHVYGHSSYTDRRCDIAPRTTTAASASSREPEQSSHGNDFEKNNESDSDDESSINLDSDGDSSREEDGLEDDNFSDVDQGELYVETMYAL